MSVELQKIVGTLVRRSRESRGLSQAELANVSARSVQLIGRIERGETAPSFDTLERLAAALGTVPATFFGPVVHGETSDHSAVLERLVARLANLSSDDLRWFEGVTVEVLKRRKT